MTHFGSRHKIHIVVVQRIVPCAGSHTKPEHSLSPSNQWTIGEDKSNDGRTVEDFLQPSGQQLGGVAPSGAIYHKQSTIEYNQESPVRTLDGTHTKSTSGDKRPKGTGLGRKTKNPGDCLRRGGACDATRTRVLGQTHQL